MRILSIETSCDETAVSVIEATGGQKTPSFKVLSSVVHTQAPLHAEWSGVVPNLAKREHANNLVPVLERALKESNMLHLETKLLENAKIKKQNEKLKLKIQKTLERESGLGEKFLAFVPNIKTPKIDVIAVTYGPGLEPALWTGINFAKALSLYWDKPVIPVNHMEGHLLSVLLQQNEKKSKSQFSIFKEKIKATRIHCPAIGLLISGGHTELILIKDWLKYKVIGHTRDDAVGEAFDKVARMLGLPYPGGPEISRMAEKYKANPPAGGMIKFPRPMIHSNDLDFSFSGLKTSVLYKIKELGMLTDELKIEIANEFEEAVIEVLVSKTKRALEQYNVKTLIIGGGVIANKKIRNAFQSLTRDKREDIKLLIPHSTLATDNATMIAIAGYFRWLDHAKKKTAPKKKFKATGNLALR